jgi:hypothetical protein
VRSDGKLLTMTWDQAQQIWGWTVCETDGQFLKVCTIYEQGEDRAYFVVKRTIGGVAKYYIERMASELWSDQADACYLDCARTFTNTRYVATFDRLDHLEGETVVAWVDGSKVSLDPSGNPLVVTNGTVQLAVGGKKVSIGLPFTAEIETLPLAIQTNAGWSVAHPQEVERALLKVINSRNVKAGVNSDELFECKQREFEDYPNPEALFTGFLPVSVSGSSGTETTITVRSDDPVPLELAVVLIEPKFGDLS